jgi:hypothetical protein
MNQTPIALNKLARQSISGVTLSAWRSGSADYFRSNATGRRAEGRTETTSSCTYARVAAKIGEAWKRASRGKRQRRRQQRHRHHSARDNQSGQYLNLAKIIHYILLQSNFESIKTMQAIRSSLSSLISLSVLGNISVRVLNAEWLLTSKDGLNILI